jgi:hypothetical protein
MKYARRTAAQNPQPQLINHDYSWDLSNIIPTLPTWWFTLFCLAMCAVDKFLLGCGASKDDLISISFFG